MSIKFEINYDIKNIFLYHNTNIFNKKARESLQKLIIIYLNSNTF